MRPKWKVYDIVTDRILEALDQGTVPWRKPWTAGIPRTATTNRAYNGINAIMLGMASYSDQRWLTFKQAGQLGGNVRKGERSTLAVFWKQQQIADDKNGESTKTIPLLRYFNVFNVQQCEGLTLSAIADSPTVEPLAAAQAIVDGMPNPPRIAHDGGNSAYYQPRTDSIHMPTVNTFHGAGEYHSTLFHELSHSTGHATRLNRDSLETPAPFGSEVYSKEELVADRPDELGYMVGLTMGQIPLDRRDQEAKEHQQPGEWRSYNVDGYSFSIRLNDMGVRPAAKDPMGQRLRQQAPCFLGRTPGWHCGHRSASSACGTLQWVSRGHRSTSARSIRRSLSGSPGVTPPGGATGSRTGSGAGRSSQNPQHEVKER